MRVRELLLTCAAAPGIALMLLGCSSGGDAEPVASSSSSTSHARSASSSTPAEAAALAEAKQRLAAGGALAPYSVKFRLTSSVANRKGLEMEGVGNLNTDFSGRMAMEIGIGTAEQQSVEVIIIGDEGYARVNDGESKGRWQRVPEEDLGADPEISVMTAYGDVLLTKHGAAAIKGEEDIDGVTALRLAGTVAVEDVREIDPRVYRNMRAANVDEYETDVWFDRQGRLVRFEQYMTIQGRRVHNVLEVGGFAKPIKVEPPLS